MVICFQIIFLVIRVFLTRSKLWGWRLKVVEDFRIDQKFPRISKMRSIIKDNQLGFFILIKREMTVPGIPLESVPFIRSYIEVFIFCHHFQRVSPLRVRFSIFTENAIKTLRGILFKAALFFQEHYSDMIHPSEKTIFHFIF